MVEIREKVVTALEEKSDSFSSSDEESDYRDPLSAVSNVIMAFPKIPSRQNSHADLPVYLKVGPPSPRKKSQQIIEVDESAFEENENSQPKLETVLVPLPETTPSPPPTVNEAKTQSTNESSKSAEVTTAVAISEGESVKIDGDNETAESSKSNPEVHLEFKPRRKERILDLHKPGSRASAFKPFGDLPIDFHEDGLDIDLNPSIAPLPPPPQETLSVKVNNEIKEVKEEKETGSNDKKKKDDPKKKDKKKTKEKEKDEEKPKKKLFGIKNSAAKHKVFHSVVEFDPEIVANAKDRLAQINEGNEGDKSTVSQPSSEEIDS